MDIRVGVEDYNQGLRVAVSGPTWEHFLTPDEALALAERIVSHARTALVNVDRAKPGTLERTQLRLAQEELRRAINSLEERMSRAEKTARGRPPATLIYADGDA